ncbi:MAG: lactonase family protein [Jiangellaceae bacterium]
MRGFLGGYGDAGIRILDVDGSRLSVRPGAAVADASFLALHPDSRTLYAVVEGSEGRVAAFGIDDESLRPLASQPTGGTSPTHLSVHPSGRFLLTANYGSGSVSVHPIDVDGSVGERTDLVRHSGSGPDPERQQGPHAHMVVAEPSGAYVLVVDLGTDSLHRYLFDSGRLTPAMTAVTNPGAGPRHVAFDPGGTSAYVVAELDSTVRVLDLRSFTWGEPVSTVPDDVAVTNHPSAVKVSADGRFCYVANRGHDSIAVFAVENGGGRLRPTTTVPCGGDGPRDLELAGAWLYVANQSSGTVTSFSLDPASGRPTPAGEPVRTPSPSCLLLT